MPPLTFAMCVKPSCSSSEAARAERYPPSHITAVAASRRNSPARPAISPTGILIDPSTWPLAHSRGVRTSRSWIGPRPRACVAQLRDRQLIDRGDRQTGARASLRVPQRASLPRDRVRRAAVASPLRSRARTSRPAATPARPARRPTRPSSRPWRRSRCSRAPAGWPAPNAAALRKSMMTAPSATSAARRAGLNRRQRSCRPDGGKQRRALRVDALHAREVRRRRRNVSEHGRDERRALGVMQQCVLPSFAPDGGRRLLPDSGAAQRPGAMPGMHFDRIVQRHHALQRREQITRAAVRSAPRRADPDGRRRRRTADRP